MGKPEGERRRLEREELAGDLAGQTRRKERGNRGAE